MAVVVFFILFYFYIFCSATEHIPIAYWVTPPTTYKGGGIFTSDCNLGDRDGLIRCPSNVRLTNNVTNEGMTIDVANFMGWNNSFALEFNFGTGEFTFTQVNIYFYNNPSAGYGLPAIRTSVSFIGQDFGPIEYSFADNSEFSQTDDQVLVIALLITTSPGILREYQFFRFNFDFTSYQITQTFLSELTFFSGTSTNVDNSPIEFTVPYQSLQYGPSTLQSSIQLNCIIANNGSFSWLDWTGPAVTSGKIKVFYADTTRTNILSINRLSSDDNGTYTCTAEYSNSEFTKHRTSTTISLTLDGMVSTNSPVTVQSSNNARLQCIFTGYLPTYYEIIWTDMTGSPINDSLDQYDIDESEGPGQSQRGGDNLDSGIVSELTIISATTDDEGIYTCSINDSTLIGTVQLFITPAVTTIDVTTTITSTATITSTGTATIPTVSGNSITVISIIVSISIMLFVLNIVTVVCVLVYCVIVKKSKSPNNQIIVELSKTTFAVTDNSAYGIMSDQKDPIYEELDDLPPHDDEDDSSYI